MAREMYEDVMEEGEGADGDGPTGAPSTSGAGRVGRWLSALVEGGRAGARRRRRRLAMLEDLQAYTHRKRIEEEEAAREDSVRARLLTGLPRGEDDCGADDALVERIFDDRFRGRGSRRRAAWMMAAVEVASGAGLLWCLLVDPFRIAFLETEAPYRLPLGGRAFFGSFAFDMLAIVEIVCRLVLEGEDLLPSRGYLASRGVWLDVAAAAALPLEMALTIRYGSSHVTAWSLVGLLRLLRGHKLGALLGRLAATDSINAVFLFLAEMVLLIASAAHLSACGFFFIAKYETPSPPSLPTSFIHSLTHSLTRSLAGTSASARAPGSRASSPGSRPRASAQGTSRRCTGR